MPQNQDCYPTKKRRETGEHKEGRPGEGRGGRRVGEDVEDNQWDDVLSFGTQYGRTYRDVYRNDQQYCDQVKTVEPKNKIFKKFQSFSRRVEEKTRENMRKELEKRQDRIRLIELSRAAAAPSAEREMNTTTDDAIARLSGSSKTRDGCKRRDNSEAVDSTHLIRTIFHVFFFFHMRTSHCMAQDDLRVNDCVAPRNSLSRVHVSPMMLHEYSLDTLSPMSTSVSSFWTTPWSSTSFRGKSCIHTCGSIARNEDYGSMAITNPLTG